MRHLALAFGLSFFVGIMVRELRAQDDLRASGEDLAQALCGYYHATAQHSEALTQLRQLFATYNIGWISRD